MPETVSPSAFAEARAALLVEEKAATRLLSSLAAKRRALPRVKVNNPSQFKFIAPNSPNKELTLLNLFEGRQQLILYEFMLPADRNDPKSGGCPGCSFFSDNVPHGEALNHLHAKSVTFCCVAPAGVEEIEAYKKRMGWTFPFYSMTELYADKDEDGENVSWKPGNGLFGLQVFIKEDDGSVYHTYETTRRGVESVLATSALLDMTPLGRRDGEIQMKRHDEYEIAA